MCSLTWPNRIFSSENRLDPDGTLRVSLCSRRFWRLSRGSSSAPERLPLQVVGLEEMPAFSPAHPGLGSGLPRASPGSYWGHGGEATGRAGLSQNPTGLLGVELQPCEGGESNHHFPDTGKQPPKKRNRFKTEGKSLLLAKYQGPSAELMLCHNPPPTLQKKRSL